MLKKPLFWETFALLFIVGILNYVATHFHLYWVVNEFDSLVHFLGGALVSMFFLWLYFFSGAFLPAKRNFFYFLLISSLGVLFVSVVWEIYELLLGEASFAKTAYSYDTTLDFIMDFLGAYAVCLYAYLRKIKYEPEVLTQQL